MEIFHTETDSRFCVRKPYTNKPILDSVQVSKDNRRTNHWSLYFQPASSWTPPQLVTDRKKQKWRSRVVLVAAPSAIVANPAVVVRAIRWSLTILVLKGHTAPSDSSRPHQCISQLGALQTCRNGLRWENQQEKQVWWQKSRILTNITILDQTRLICWNYAENHWKMWIVLR